MHMCMYCECGHVYMCVCVWMYAHARVEASVSVCACVYSRTCVCVCVSAHARSLSLSYITNVCLCMCVYICTCVCMHTRARACICSKTTVSTTCKELFSVTKRLMNKTKCTQIPSSVPVAQLPQRFSNFFCQKISTIRQNIDSSLALLPLVLLISFFLESRSPISAL